ncbi:MAG TPA: hypothetical protein VFH73_05890, partial [Polyangia bacterium]|nr:hypothetical protein [Polyangia bacterium]
DTGHSLYHRLEVASLELFRQTWPALAAGEAPRVTQVPGAGTTHRTADVQAVDEIDLDRNYRARDLINLLRARTFPPYKGAYFRDGRDRVYLRLQLDREGAGGEE